MAEADPSRYYAPIIEAMIASAQAREKVASRLQEREQAQAELKLKEAQEKNLRLHQAEMERQGQVALDQAEELHKATIKNQADKLQSDLQLAGIQAKGALQGLIKGGYPEAALRQEYPGIYSTVQPSVRSYGEVPEPHTQIAPELAQFRTPVVPGEVPWLRGTVSQEPVLGEQPGTLYDPEQAIRNLETQYAAEEAGKARGKQPFEIELANLRASRELENIAAQRAMHESVAEIQGKWHLKGIQEANKAKILVDPGEMRDTVEGIFNGAVDYSKLPIDEKRAVDAYTRGTGEAKYLPNNYKKYTDSISSVSSVQPLMESLYNLAENYSRDSPGAFGKGNQYFGVPVAGAMGRVEPGSELDSEMSTLSGLAGRFAQFFDNWVGRKSNQEIIRQIKGVFDPKLTMKENLQKIEDHKKVMRQNIRDMFPGFSKERINSIVSERGINTIGAFGPEVKGPGEEPDWLKLAPEKNKIGHKLDKEKSLRFGSPVYVP